MDPATNTAARQITSRSREAIGSVVREKEGGREEGREGGRERLRRISFSETDADGGVFHCCTRTLV